jgi:uncharacterized protein YdeI (BOF family)
MNKFALAALVASVVAAPAFAADEMKKEAAPAPAAAAPAPVAAAPAAGAVKKVELKDGSWAQVEGDMVKVSKDAGKTWMPAPDGTHEAKDGSKVTTKGGKLVK